MQKECPPPLFLPMRMRASRRHASRALHVRVAPRHIMIDKFVYIMYLENLNMGCAALANRRATDTSTFCLEVQCSGRAGFGVFRSSRVVRSARTALHRAPFRLILPGLASPAALLRRESPATGSIVRKVHHSVTLLLSKRVQKLALTHNR